MDSSFSFTNFVTAAAITFFTLLGSIFFLFFNKKLKSHQETETAASSLSPMPLKGKHVKFPELPIKQHLFVSFHGADVRETLLSHIIELFRSKGISTFIDNDMDRGVSIGPVLTGAIRGSRIALVLLSERYASSTWCLNELVEIIKCRDELKQKVMTLFYKVDPSDVKKQTGDFGKVFRETCKGKKKGDIRRWEHALKEVAQIAGYHSGNWDNEAEMIKTIATEVSNKLNNSTPSSDLEGLVGMESHMTKMRPLLQLDSEEVRVIGLWGLPGIGKTTIARSLFERHSGDFQLSLFMDNIKTKYGKAACSDDYNVMKYLQKKLMSQLIKEEGLEISHLGNVQDRLKDKKVFVVLDDVDQLVQLEAMARDTTWFGDGSLIIITTQDQKLLKACEVNDIYKVGLPSTDEALEMFCMYAFGQKKPEAGFRELASKVTEAVGRLPLGLRIMGSYFRGLSKSKQEWEKELRRRLMIRPNREIESILMFSYDALHEEDKNLFLHIACFFEDESVDTVEGCLADSFPDVTLGLRVLAEKSLIDMTSGRIWMHDLLIQLGREIVRKQSDSEPGKRQFLDDDANDIEKVLSDDKADTSSVIGIRLRFRKDIICRSERAFERFSNLRFLQIDGIAYEVAYNVAYKVAMSNAKEAYEVAMFNAEEAAKVAMSNAKEAHDVAMFNIGEGYIVAMSNAEEAYDVAMFNVKEAYDDVMFDFWSMNKKLRFLNWTGFGKPCLLSSFDPEFLVTLVMQHSKLEKLWDDIRPLGNLKEMDLSYSHSLEELPDLSTATNLCELDLSYCISLVVLSSSIGNVVNLKKLDLSYCKSLVVLPFSIGNAVNLKKLYLTGCTSLVELPWSIGNAVNLQHLDLSYCTSLMELPFSIGSVVNLQHLDLSYCTSLVELPSSMRNLCRLWKLGLEKCSKLVVNLANINLESLEELDLSFCSVFKSYPESSTSIQDYHKLSGAAIKEAPSLGPWIGRMSRLRLLKLRGMEKLVSLPQLPYSLLELDAEDCESLKRLDCSFSNPDIRHLNFGKCYKLNQEARDLIIQTPTNGYAVLPGEKVPVCFPYRSTGSSVTVKLNQMLLGKSTKFKVCIIFVKEKRLRADDLSLLLEGGCIYCSITSKQNALGEFYIDIRSILEKHMYIFEVEAVEVTSTELAFEFVFGPAKGYVPIEIKECGVLQLLEVPSC